MPTPLPSGVERARSIDQRLRQIEQAEREQRLADFAFSVEIESDAQDGHVLASGLGGETAELRSILDRYQGFHHAVQHSRVWRVAQLLRGLVGRRW